MYKIFFTKEAYKTFLRMPRNIALLIRQKLEIIADNPYTPRLNVKKLQNRPGLRFRVGDWRVIYTIDNDKLNVLVLKIVLRGEAYR
ncbi:MAG: type II toxin-antitoxin system RelE/ParE family toxin [Candidatus Omnitrophota bacterium]